MLIGRRRDADDQSKERKREKERKGGKGREIQMGEKEREKREEFRTDPISTVLEGKGLIRLKGGENPEKEFLLRLLIFERSAFPRFRRGRQKWANFPSFL